MDKRDLYIVVLLFLFSNASFISVYTQRGDVRVMFYNVENLFDTIDDPTTYDEEFLPEGDKNWNGYRYWNKIKKTFQVIAAAGEEISPEIIGFCEVESYLALYNLVQNTPLSKYSYSIIHKDSPDRRGIDVALIYNSGKVNLIHSEFIKITFPSDTAKKTRDILYASFGIKEDTLHVFYNHWPSRRGGEMISAPFRIYVARVLKSKINSIVQKNSDAKIVVMGDLNDEPHNESLDELTGIGLINLSDKLKNRCKCGTYKYKSHWNMLDQVLISPTLLLKSGLHTSEESLSIFKADFLLDQDTRNGGVKPFRTYLGPRYIGGYSDHLPIFIDLYHFK